MKSSEEVAAIGANDSGADFTFTSAITAVSRLLLARDRLFGKIPKSPAAVDPAISVQRISIGDARLDAVLVSPATPKIRASLLICHGIGEIVEHWTPVQRLLASEGITSLVFDYSGYGRSPGRLTPRQCELNTIAAFEYLRDPISSMPISVLGFSMGTGVAAAVLDRLPVYRLVLCAAFTSFKAAAASAGWPDWLSGITPDIWRTEETLRKGNLPILIVHGENDRLFPAQMAADLHAASAGPATLVVVPGLAHDDPYYNPDPAYWKIISDFLIAP